VGTPQSLLVPMETAKTTQEYGANDIVTQAPNWVPSVTLPPVSTTTQGNATGVSGGAANVADENQVGQYFNPTLRKEPTWKALTQALSAGDASVSQVANTALNQLYLSTASGSYLEKRASEFGLKKPYKTWLSDELFRQLAVTVTNQKMTRGALLGMLEVFYGPKSVRACLATTLKEPYSLRDGSWLRILVDEKYLVTVDFRAEDFTNISLATAQEVSSIISQALGPYGLAQTAMDYYSGLVYVEMYSASRGLNSSLRAVGGTAQPFLGFPTNLFPLATAFSSWQVLNLGTKARYSCSDAANYNLGLVDTGDYINILDPAFDSGNRGSFIVVSTGITGSSYFVEVNNPNAVDEIVTQIQSWGVTVFQPTRVTPYDNSNYVEVTQIGGSSYVSLPATAECVSRNYSNAAYLRQNAAVEITSLVRDSEGLVTVTAAGHSLTAGDWFELFDLDFDYGAESSVTAGSGGQSSLTARTYPSYDTVRPACFSRAVRDLVGNVWVIGGTVGGISNLNNVSVFQITGVTENPDGSRQNSYAWTSYDNAAIQPFGSAACVLDVSTNYNTLLVIGGDPSYAPGNTQLFTLGSGGISMTTGANAPYAAADSTLTWLPDPISQAVLIGGRDPVSALDAVEFYMPQTNLWGISRTLLQARFQHQAIQFGEHKVLVIGGRTNAVHPYEPIGVSSNIDAFSMTPALNTCEIVSLYDETVAAASMTYARFAFGMTRLPDGRILVVGGIGYNPSTASPNILSYSWRQCELNSAEIYDPIYGTWSVLPSTLEPHSYCVCEYVASENKVFVFGGYKSRLIEYLDLDDMRWKRLPDLLAAGQVFGAAALAGNDVPFLSGGAEILPDPNPITESAVPLNGSTTLGIASYGGSDSGLEGAHKVLGVCGTSFTFQSFGAYATASSGSIVSTKAPSDPRVNGPFIYDSAGVAVTGIFSTTTSTIESGAGKGSVGVDDLTGFPENGWVCFNFGYSNQVGPVHYHSLTADSILFDSSFRFYTEVPVGSEIRVLTGKAAYVPPTSINGFHITASEAGLLGAESFLDKISATGIDLNVTVRYPGDRGLGSEGRPLKGSLKISDIIALYGGDETDLVVQEARNG